MQPSTLYTCVCACVSELSEHSRTSLDCCSCTVGWAFASPLMPSPRPACLLLATTASRASHRRLAHATTSQSSAALPLFVSLSCRVHVLGLHRDFAHTVDKFYGELPEDANDFGAELNNVFPLIFDTKHVLSRYFVICEHLPKSREQPAADVLGTSVRPLCPQLRLAARQDPRQFSGMSPQPSFCCCTAQSSLWCVFAAGGRIRVAGEGQRASHRLR